MKKEFLKKVPYLLGERSFPALLVFVCLSLLLGGLLFYKYSILAEKKEPQVSEVSLKFERECFQRILKEKQNREERFQEIQTKVYSDPFRKN